MKTFYASESAAHSIDRSRRYHSYREIYLNFPCSRLKSQLNRLKNICARLFCGLALCARSAYGAKRDGDVTWMLDRVGERALIRLFCLGVHSPAHYQAYCPSHCYPYLDVSLFCNFPHLTDTTASPSTPIPTPFSFLSSAFAPRCSLDQLGIPVFYYRFPAPSYRRYRKGKWIS